MTSERAGERARYVKLSPELGDGSSWSLVTDKAILLELVGTWWDEFHDDPLGGFQVEVVEMTKEEVDALPEL